MLYNRRKFKRFDISLIIGIKPNKRTSEYFMGMTRNLSCEGFSFELHNFEIEQKENIEFKLKYPRSDLCVSFFGDVVWNKQVNTECLSGIKLRDMDKETENKFIKTISAFGNIPVDYINYFREIESVLRKKEEKSISKLSVGQKDKLIFETFKKDRRSKIRLYIPVVIVIVAVIVIISFVLFINTNKVSQTLTPVVIKKEKTDSQKANLGASSGKDIVQVGAYNNIDNANKLIEKSMADNHRASRTIYTIQTGSFINMIYAQDQFNSLIKLLNKKELDYIRIEKIGQFNAVRLGKFEDYATAKKFLHSIKPQLSTAIILKAYIEDNKDKKLYEYNEK